MAVPPKRQDGRRQLCASAAAALPQREGLDVPSRGPALTVLQLLLGRPRDVPTPGAAAQAGGVGDAGPPHRPPLHIGVAMGKKNPI